MSPVDDFSRFANIIPEEHLSSLQVNLARVPDFSWLLNRPHPTLERLQGDLINNFPTVFLDHNRGVKQWSFTVMVLNNSCDLPDDRLDCITVAPIFDFGKFARFEIQKRDLEKCKSYLESVRRNDVTELFYLPPFAGFSEGALVFLDKVCSVSSNLYKVALQQGARVASFSQTGFYFLLIKLTTHIARAENPDVVRIA